MWVYKTNSYWNCLCLYLSIRPTTTIYILIFCIRLLSIGKINVIHYHYWECAEEIGQYLFRFVECSISRIHTHDTHFHICWPRRRRRDGRSGVWACVGQYWPIKYKVVCSQRRDDDSMCVVDFIYFMKPPHFTPFLRRTIHIIRAR